MGSEVGSVNATLWMVVILVPVVLASATAFTKTSIVLGALRVGLGADALLPVGLLLAVSLVVTAVIMGPVLTETWLALLEAGGLPSTLDGPVARWTAVFEPLRTFVERHAAPDEVEFFASLQGRSATDPMVLVPAFLVTELAEGFAIAVLIIVPFVVIDLVVAQVVTLFGLIQQPIPLLTLPLKLLLFLAVDGWDTVIGGLVEGYR